MRSLRIVLPLLFWFAGGSLCAAQGITEIRLATDPVEGRVRPGETLVVQLRAYGERTDAEGKTEKVRLAPMARAEFRVIQNEGGWLSKPFRFQGKEEETFYEPESSGLGSILLGRATREYVMQDAVLYTAPPKPGKYTVEVSANGSKAKVEIVVDRSASSTKLAETRNFGPERRERGNYRSLAEYWSPFIAQETWFQPKADYLARFDFDGDWNGVNNWEQAEQGSSQAFVYYAAMETATHWFLIYNFFHPRDYSDKCVAGTCHENDNEGMILTIRKDGSRFGRVEVMETLAHNNIYSFRADKRVKKGVHDLDGEVEFIDKTHPVIFIEAGGHGVYGASSSHSLFSAGKGVFSGGTGVTYRYKGRAERPDHSNARDVGYELLPIYEHWWQASQQAGKGDLMFDDFFRYEPAGGRPEASIARLGGAFRGRSEGVNKAKPFWGWHDRRTSSKQILSTGQWGLDPAYSVDQNLEIPRPFSLDYLFNPYLSSGAGNPAEPAPPPVVEVPPRNLEGTPLVVRKSSDYDEDATRGYIELRLKVDDVVELMIAGDQVSYKLLGGRPPLNEGVLISQPVPRVREFKGFKVSKQGGRGNVTLLEAPSPGNGHMARIRVVDSKKSDDRYRVRVEWEFAEEERIIDEPSAGALPPLPGDLLDVVVQESAPGSRGGRLEFSGRVDEIALFRIRGREVTAQTVRGRPVIVESIRMSNPLPLGSGAGPVELKKKGGRGNVILLEPPSETNGFIAVVQVIDTKKGDDRYRFELTWK